MKALREFLKEYVISNATAKLMALAMAVALWLYAFVFSNAPPLSLRLPMIIRAPEGWSSAFPGSLEVEATITYPRRFAGQVDQAQRAGRIRVECHVSVPESGQDEQQIRVVPREADLLPRDLSIRVLGFNPQEMTVNLVRETAATVRVIPKVSAPPPGYVVTYTYPTPTAVTVRGRKDIVAILARTGIETEEIPIGAPPPMKAAEWPISLPANIPNRVTIEGIRHPIRCDEKVQVRILLSQQAAERTFAAIPIRLLMPPDYPLKAELREQVSDVLVRGPAITVDALKPENIVLYVDVGALREPKELPYTQQIRAHVVEIPGAGELLIKPLTANCAVKISLPASP